MNIALLVTVGLGLLALLVVLIAWVGPDRFVKLWTALPLKFRSAINVALAAAIAFGGSQAVDYLTKLDIPDWLKLGITAVLVPIIRTLNSADPYTDPTPEVTGAHEASSGDTTGGEQ